LRHSMIKFAHLEALLGVTGAVLAAVLLLFALETEGLAQAAPGASTVTANALSGAQTVAVEEASIGGTSAFSRAMQGGIVVFTVLVTLIGFSVATWALIFAKWFYLKRIDQVSEAFIKSFWESRSLNDLNGRLHEFPYSPVREVFRGGYAELVRGSQLKDQAASRDLALQVVVDNLTRSLHKARTFERRRLERYLPFLAMSASAAPFIGLFGTVWGIMGAFEGIARSGSASLAAVAPGISEALIATAFGLAAAIPAVMGYNVLGGRVRMQMGQIEGFASDFLNIVERYIATDKPSRENTGAVVSVPSGPL